MAYEILQEICRLAGYLIAHQAGITAEGEIAIPRALFTTEEKPGSAQLLVFESESYQTAVENGRSLIKTEGGQFRCWVLAFDVNLRSPTDGSKTGDALYVEAGGRSMDHKLEFLQPYTPKSEGTDFHLDGDVIAVRQEEWPPTVAKGMESIGWHDFVVDGARVHPLVGELWDKWHMVDQQTEWGSAVDALSMKSESVRELVRALGQRLGEQTFAIVDHWDADPTAIGIASVRDPRVLAYVSVSEHAPRYFVSFETPPSGKWVDHPYTPGEERCVETLDEVASLVEKHITSYIA